MNWTNKRYRGYTAKVRKQGIGSWRYIEIFDPEGNKIGRTHDLMINSWAVRSFIKKQIRKEQNKEEICTDVITF